MQPLITSENHRAASNFFLVDMSYSACALFCTKVTHVFSLVNLVLLFDQKGVIFQGFSKKGVKKSCSMRVDLWIRLLEGECRSRWIEAGCSLHLSLVYLLLG